MNALDDNWLSADLARVDSDIERWSAGIRESFESLYGEGDVIAKDLASSEQNNQSSTFTLRG